MFKIYVLLALIAFAYAVPVPVDEETIADTVVDTEVAAEAKSKAAVETERKIVEILESGLEREQDGSYTFHYRGADGTFREETAVVMQHGTKNEHLSITGAYSFIDSDGKQVVVNYKADSNGFVPVGSNIPEVISVVAKQNSENAQKKKLALEEVAKAGEVKAE